MPVLHQDRANRVTTTAGEQEAGIGESFESRTVQKKNVACKCILNKTTFNLKVVIFWYLSLYIAEDKTLPTCEVNHGVCVCRTRASFKQFCKFAVNTDYAGTIRLCEIIKVQLLSCGRSVQKLIKRKVTQDRHTIIMKTRIPLKLMFQHWDVLPLFSH